MSVHVCDIMLKSTLEEFLRVIKGLKREPREWALRKGLKRSLKKGPKKRASRECLTLTEAGRDALGCVGVRH